VGPRTVVAWTTPLEQNGFAEVHIVRGPTVCWIEAVASAEP
jgi:hypothetical protein